MSPGASGRASEARLHLAVFLQGASLLALEVVLARVLAVVMWHHFASLVISLALLGMTIGAMTVYLRPPPEGGGSGRLASASLLFGLSAATVFGFFWFITRYPAMGYGFFSALHQPYFEPFGSGGGASADLLLRNLTVMFMVLALPFFAGGLFITDILSRAGRSAGSLYAADLLGAGSGCFLAVALLGVTDGLSAVLLAALPALASAALLAGGVRRRRLAVVAALAVAALAWANTARPFARLMFVRGRYQPDIIYEKWDATSRVVVYPLGGNQEEGSWGQSRRYAGRLPSQMGLVVDDTGYTTLTAWPADGDLTFMRHNLIALPYVLKPRARTLIVGPGGGRDILAALAMEAASVTAVEINPLVVEAVDGVFGDFSGRLYSRPGVHTAVAEGRSYLRRDRDMYDVLQASIVYGRLPPSAGAFTLSEDQLYTLEAFREYLDHLAPDGVLSVTRFIYEKRILRLVALGRAALEKAGAASPGRHFFIAAERGLATVILKKSPLTGEEVRCLEEWCREMGYQVLYAPGRAGGGAFGRILEEGAGGPKWSPGFDLSPPTDDRPYFYYLLRPADFWRTMAAGGGYEFEDRSIIIIRNAMALLALFTLVLVFLPLLRRSPGGRGGSLPGTVVYFGGIALGFITVEIILLKTLILYLGFPVLSLSVVLAALLMSAGLGSLAARRFFSSGRRGPLALWLALAAAAVAIFPAASRPVIEATVASPLALRVVLSAVMILPLGFCLGVPLPAGLQVLRRREEGLLPWAFGINGAVSVLGAMVALVLALNYGFSATWWTAPLSYAAAALALPLLKGREGA